MLTFPPGTPCIALNVYIELEKKYMEARGLICSLARYLREGTEEDDGKRYSQFSQCPNRFRDVTLEPTCPALFAEQLLFLLTGCNCWKRHDCPVEEISSCCGTRRLIIAITEACH
jgi:hypothetical protein